MKAFEKIIRGLTLAVSALAWVAMIVALILATQYSITTVVSGSMVPALKIGDSVVVQNAKAADCKKGDIVVYSNPNSGLNIIHRVVDVITTVRDDENGGSKLVTILRVKGDANALPDDVDVTDEDDIRKVVIMPSPFLNRLVSIFKSKVMYIVMASLLVIGVMLIKSSKKEDSKEKNKKQEENKETSDKEESTEESTEESVEESSEETVEESEESTDESTEEDEVERMPGPTSIEKQGEATKTFTTAEILARYRRKKRARAVRAIGIAGVGVLMGLAIAKICKD